MVRYGHNHSLSDSAGTACKQDSRNSFDNQFNIKQNSSGFYIQNIQFNLLVKRYL